MFFKGSRYERVADESIIDPSGREVRHKRVRFIPETVALVKHTVAQGERLDQIAYAYFRNAELFWRIADANRAMKAEDLVAEPGFSLGIPGAEG